MFIHRVKDDESEDKFYYDIPIKDTKKKSQSNYKDSANFFNSHTKFIKPKESSSAFGDNFSTLDTKRHIIAEILKESANTLTEKKSERPFTPPFTTLVRMSSSRSIENNDAKVEIDNEETKASNINEKKIINDPGFTRENSPKNKLNGVKDDNTLSKSLQFLADDKRNHELDLIYDHVLGCYYDPKTNLYYELKNN